MKPVYLTVLVSIICLTFVLISCEPTKDPSIEVMTWNIWHGGLHGTKADNFEKDSSHTINVLKVLQESDPDILLMQETYCCGMEIAKEAGYEYAWRASSNLSIHSKYPIIDTIPIFKPFNSQAAIIEVNGEQILFINLWLHYLPDYFVDIKSIPVDSILFAESRTRLKEITAILNAIDSLDAIYNLPIIVGGDFNSASHLDWIESTKEQHYGHIVEWPISKLMLAHGFKDTFREAHPDPRTSLQGTWGYLSEGLISDRIDYIYSKGQKLEIVDSKIIMEDPKGGYFNSDHRAIQTHFRIRN